MLSEPGWCYVVKLAAMGGVALTSADLPPGGPARPALTSADPPAPGGAGSAAPAAGSGPPAGGAAGNGAGDAAGALPARLAAMRLQGAEPVLAPRVLDDNDAFDDPLRRQADDRVSGQDPAAGGAAPGQQQSAPRAPHRAASGAGGRGPGVAEGGSVPLFTGFVSHEQLEEVMGSRCALDTQKS